MTNRLHVGGRSVPFADAVGWARAYFGATMAAAGPYAYPFYDRMDTGSGPDELNDGDLLAPVLLNVPVSIVAFRSLQAMRDNLQDGLAHIPTTLTLQAAVAVRQHELPLTGLVAVLDQEPPLPGVLFATLSKVLHRKRPMFFPLYDQFVKACYVSDGDGFPIRETAFNTMPWARFAGHFAEAIVNDLVRQAELWHRLRAAATVPADVSELRLLDVVAWNLGKLPPGAAAPPQTGR